MQRIKYDTRILHADAKSLASLGIRSDELRALQKPLEYPNTTVLRGLRRDHQIPICYYCYHYSLLLLLFRYNIGGGNAIVKDRWQLR